LEKHRTSQGIILVIKINVKKNEIGGDSCCHGSSRQLNSPTPQRTALAKLAIFQAKKHSIRLNCRE
jgi:hypothetical protein